MSQSLTVARPYARAAFELAKEHDALGEWSARLAFVAAIAADAGVVDLFGDPRVDETQLVSLFLPEGEAADSAFALFLATLADNGRLRALPEIAALFEGYKRDAENVLKVNVRTAAAMGDAEADRLKAALERRFGRRVELERTLDPAVLGGAIVDAGEIVIDGSVRGQLARLETAVRQ